MMMRIIHCLIILTGLFYLRSSAYGQDTIPRPVSDTIAVRDTVPVTDSLIVPVPKNEDSVLRITNLNPYITLHVDSTLRYKLDINKDPGNHYWYLRNAPVGLKIDKDNGMLTFKAEKSFFL